MNPEIQLRYSCMPPKAHTITIQLTPGDYERVQAAAKYSGQTVEEWIESMCQVSTLD
jgi:uncharacterized protein (DUF1778 family)